MSSPSATSTRIVSIEPWTATATGWRASPTCARCSSYLDGVLVLTPDHTREELTIAALEAGIATFVGEALGHHHRGRRPDSRRGASDGVAALRRPQHAARPGRAGDARPHRPGRHRRGEGDLVPALRGTRRRLLLQGLARRPALHDESPGAEGGSRPRRDPLASRLLHRSRQRDGGLVVYGAVANRLDRSGQLLVDWFEPERNWPPTALTGLAPVIDVEDISMVNLALEHGESRTRERCVRELSAVPLHPRLLARLHRASGYWRDYTVRRDGRSARELW